MRRSFCLLICFFASASPSLAQLDPESTKPYELKVVLDVARHRNLTPGFKDRLKRELHDNLQAALGGLARVEVVEHHPLLKDVVDGGSTEFRIAGNPPGQCRSFILSSSTSSRATTRLQHASTTAPPDWPAHSCSGYAPRTATWWPARPRCSFRTISACSQRVSEL